jgi:ABC-type transport system substrate-binding protein
MNLANQPWSDVRVRRALSLAIDRDLLITSVASGWASYGNPLPWHFFGQEWPFEPEQLGQWYQYNPERAKEMLKEAGYEGGFKTDVVTTTTTLVGTYGDTWQTAWDMWKKNLGVEVSVSTVPDFAALTKMYTSVEYPNLITYGVVVGGATDPHNYVDPTRSDSPANYWHLKDAKIDELVLKQRRELDPEKRRQILMEWFNYETDNVLRMWTTNFWALIFRQPNVYNAWSQTDMWGLGGAGSAKVKERVWKAA